jgi:hypothetical protein
MDKRASTRFVSRRLFAAEEEADGMAGGVEQADTEING